jgi:hypothetical protein
MLAELSPAHLREVSGGLEALGAALHQAAVRHAATVTGARAEARRLGDAGDAPALRQLEATLGTTAWMLADAPAHLEDAGSRARSLARDAATTASALSAIDHETASAAAATRIPDLDPAAQQRHADRVRELARRRGALVEGWEAACRTAEHVFEQAGAALATVEQRLHGAMPPTVPTRLARATVGTWRLTEDIRALRDGLDVRAHAATLRDARQRQLSGTIERERRLVTAARRVARGVQRAAVGAARTTPPVVRRLGASGRDATLRLVAEADRRAAQLSSSRLGRGVRAVGSHPTMRAVGKRLGPLGLALDALDIAGAVRDGRYADAAVAGLGAAGGGVVLLAAAGFVATPVGVVGAVVVAGVVIYEHREQIAAAGRWVGDRVRNGLRRLRGDRPRCP